MIFQTFTFINTVITIYRILSPPGNKTETTFVDGNTFQNLKVSSPAPVTIVCPSGDNAKYKTLDTEQLYIITISNIKHKYLYVCPVNVANFCIEGYFHTTI